MSIRFDSEARIFVLETAHTSYHMKVDALGHLALLLHAEDEVHALHPCNLACLQLGIASDNNNRGIGMLAMQAVNGLPALLIGSLGHATGIDNAHICLFAIDGGENALRLQLVAKGRGFRKIEFTAQRDVGRTSS